MKKLTMEYKGTKTLDNLSCSIKFLEYTEMENVVNFLQGLPGIIIQELLENKEHSSENGGVVKEVCSRFYDSEGKHIYLTWYAGTGTLLFQGNSDRLFNYGITFLKDNYEITFI